jgi:hypothetical protein
MIGPAVVEQALLAAGFISLFLVVATGATAFVVARRIRRRFRSWRSRTALRDPATLVRASGSAVVASVGSPTWWAVQDRRHRMWKSVSSAEQAVRLARRAGVPVGDLPALVGRLSAAATGLDAVLRANGRERCLRAEDRLDCDRIIATADEVRVAALDSLRSGSHAETDTVVSALRIEVAAVAAGLRAARG